MGFFDPATKQVVGAGGSGGKVRSSSPSLDRFSAPVYIHCPACCCFDCVLTLVCLCALDTQVFKNTLSDECLNVKKSERMWELSCEVTGAKWPKLTIAA